MSYLPNKSYSQSRNAVELHVGRFKTFLKQVVVSRKDHSFPTMTVIQLQTLCDAICGILNSQPLGPKTLLTANHFINPNAHACDFQISHDVPTEYVDRLRSYLDKFREMRVEVMESNYLKFVETMKGRKNFRGLVEGDSVWFYKNPDNKSEGICYGTVLEKHGSDYMIETSSGVKLTLPYMRLYLFLRGDFDYCV